MSDRIGTSARRIQARKRAGRRRTRDQNERAPRNAWRRGFFLTQPAWHWYDHTGTPTLWVMGEAHPRMTGPELAAEIAAGRRSRDPGPFVRWYPRAVVAVGGVIATALALWWWLQ